MRRDEAVDLRLDSTDIVEIETQYDDRRKTVLYVHVNGVTVLRIQGIQQKDQDLIPEEKNSKLIIMRASVGGQ